MSDIDRERARSLKFVQVVFALLAIGSLVSGLAVAHSAAEFGLPDTSSRTIAVAFLSVGAMNTALLLLWEHIFDRMSS